MFWLHVVLTVASAFGGDGGCHSVVWIVAFDIAVHVAVVVVVIVATGDVVLTSVVSR